MQNCTWNSKQQKEDYQIDDDNQEKKFKRAGKGRLEWVNLEES